MMLLANMTMLRIIHKLYDRYNYGSAKTPVIIFDISNRYIAQLLAPLPPPPDLGPNFGSSGPLRATMICAIIYCSITCR